VNSLSFKPERITIAIALLLIFVTTQVYVDVSSADPGPVVSGESSAMPPPQITGILTTLGNKEITVNGTHSISGATIVSGASIETPAGGGATIGFVSRGLLQIQPNTKLTIEFDQSGVKVVLTEGCVSLRTKKGTTGEISTSTGSIGKTDPAQDGNLERCPDRSAAPVVAAGAGGLFVLGTAAALAIIVGEKKPVAVPVAQRGVLY
jgi:hypothetical protein